MNGHVTRHALHSSTDGWNWAVLAAFAVLAWLAAGCGRSASDTLRTGQLPISDFPLFLTDGVGGTLHRFERDRSSRVLVRGLKDPRGVATDRFNNLYVAEFGAGRVLRVHPDTGETEVACEGLKDPSILATDSFGEVFVGEDGTKSLVRCSDKKAVGSFSSAATALVFGVDDRAHVGLFAANRTFWGARESAESVEVASPVGAAVDGTGRVYVASGDAARGTVTRFHQDSPGAPTKVADVLQGPLGLAVDSVGNLYLVEQGARRIVLLTTEGKKYSWATGFSDPQYLAFSKY